MRIAFKSLVVLHEMKTSVGDTTTTCTTYDMNSVQGHELDVSFCSLAFHPEASWRLAILMFLPAILLAIWTEGNPLQMVLGAIPFLLLFWPLSYAVTKNLVLEQYAKSERGLAPDSRVNVVLADRWAMFLSKLQPPTGLAKLQMQSDQFSQSLSAAIRRLQDPPN